MIKQVDKKTIFVIFIVPLQFFLQLIVNTLNLPVDSLFKNLLLLGVSVIVVSLVFLLRGDLLKRDFQKFKENKMKLLLISIVSAVVSALLVIFIKKLILASGLTSLSMSSSNVSDLPNAWLMLIASIPPTLAPFLEETVFRYELFYRLNSSKLTGFIFAIISSILFGLLHYFNYNGNIVLTIPLMAVGFFYCIIYKLTDNIWTSIFAHMFYNGALSIGSSLFVLIIQLLR
ncbi:MAG: type II CAAX endopeptidase family protein [Peptostreptococcus sp.]|uniref:CPBP family intramembrane glutamic endopeptidase n=1 Tax=Peptostreptococcus sp. TaxID=1262 RepID=UPI002FCC4F84